MWDIFSCWDPDIDPLRGKGFRHWKYSFLFLKICNQIEGMISSFAKVVRLVTPNFGRTALMKICCVLSKKKFSASCEVDRFINKKQIEGDIP